MAVFTGNILYYAYFTSKDETITYKVEIKKQDYSGGATEIVNLSTSPVNYRIIEQEDSNIRGSEMVFEFLCNKANFDDFDELTNCTNFQYEFKLYRCSTSQNQYTFPLWTGYVINAETSHGLFDENALYKITATDFLSKLKNIDFSNDSGQIPLGRYSMAAIVGWCLNKIPDFAGVFIERGLYESHMPDGHHALSQAYIYPQLFTKNKDGLIVPDNCYDVLNNILIAFQYELSSPLLNYDDVLSAGNPRYFIRNQSILSSYYDWCEYDNVNKTLAYVFTDILSITINIDTKYFRTDSEFLRELPSKFLTLLQHNYDFGETFDEEIFEDFDNLSIWARANIASISESSGIYSAQVNGGLLGAFTTINAYTLNNTTGNKYIQIRFTIKNTTPWQTSGTPLENLLDSMLSFKIRVLQETPTKDYKTDIVMGVLPGQTLLFISPISSVYEIIDGGTYEFQIQIDCQASDVNHTFEISNVSINTVYANNGQSMQNVIFDTIFEGFTESNIRTDDRIELKIGDSDIVHNSSAITFSTDDDDITNSWYRVGKAETKSIQELIFQNFFNLKGGNVWRLQIGVFDPSLEICLNKTITFDGDVYSIINFSRDLRSNWCELLIQKISYTDIGITVLRKNTASSGTNGSTPIGSGNGSTGGTQVITMAHSALTGLNLHDHKYYNWGPDINRNGFLSQDETSISFDDSTYTFSLTMIGLSWTYYRAGLKFIIEESKTVILSGTPPANAKYYIYIDGDSGILIADTTSWTLLDFKIPVAIVIFNNSLNPKYFLCDERHTVLIDRRQHLKEHATEGTKYASGGVLAGYTLNTDSDSAKKFSIDNTYIFDEDIRLLLPTLDKPTGTSENYFIGFLSSGNWIWAKSELAFKFTGSDFIEYDNSGTMTPASTNKYINYYLFCTNIKYSGCFQFIAGKQEFSNPTDAHNELVSDFDLTGIYFIEGVSIWMFTYKTNASYSSKGKCVLERVKKINSNLLTTSINIGPGSGDVVGPSSSVDSNFVFFSGITGKLIKDSGIKLSDFNIDATIGAGGQYADIKTAIAASKYRLKAVGNISDAGALTTIPSGQLVIVDLNGYDLTVTNYTYNFSGLLSKLIIINGTITLNGNPGSTAYFNPSQENQLYIADCTINCSQTAGSNPLFYNGIAYRVNFIVSSGFSSLCVGTNTGYYRLRDCFLTINNSSAYYCMFVGMGSVIQNLSIAGSAPTNSNGIILLQSTDNNRPGVVENLNLVVNSTVYITGRTGIIKNLRKNTGTLNFKQSDGGGSGIANIIIKDSYIDGISNVASFAGGAFKYDNVTFGTAISITIATVEFYKCKFLNTFSIASNSAIIKNNRFDNTITINADYIKFISNICAQLVTMQSGSEYNVLTENTFTSGLTDNSASTTNQINDNI